jgi:hypothetical protein
MSAKTTACTLRLFVSFEDPVPVEDLPAGLLDPDGRRRPWGALGLKRFARRPASPILASMQTRSFSASSILFSVAWLAACVSGAPKDGTEAAGGGGGSTSGHGGAAGAGGAPCAAYEETCNGFDDDCDGVVDQNNPESGLPCMTDAPGICGPGSTQCRGGAITCVALFSAKAEECNGADDDCDGTIDNDNPGTGAACSTGMNGVCADGTSSCFDGALVCERAGAPSAERCNNLDDDCDGQVDEGQPEACTPCGPPGPPGTCPAYSLCVDGAVICGPQGPQVPPGSPCPPPPPACGAVP